MPSLQPVRVRGRTYWRIVECRRVKGKPRPIPILYLGTAQALLDRLLQAEAGRVRVRSYEHGAVAALKAAADRLGVASIIDDKTNKKSTLARRGRSKQKRHDLRIFSLALLVSRDGHVPLLSHVYEGNRADAKVFATSLTAIRDRLQKLSVSLKGITLVYDKGNNSKKNLALTHDAPFGYVASLVPSQHRELVDIPVSSYARVPRGHLEGTPALRLKRNIWGAERTVVLFVSNMLRAGQVRGLEQHVQKLLGKLNAWKEKLEKPRSGSKSVEDANRKINSMLAGQYLKRIVRVSYDPERDGAKRLSWRIDEAAREQLEREVFGKRILVTDRDGWTDEEIILAYRGQSEVEGAFRQLKDDEHLAIRPQYHWIDHKVRVHVFICLVAFLLARVVEREARAAGRRECLSGILDLLGGVRLAMVLTRSAKKGGRPRASWQLEEADPEVLKLFRRLVPARPPFVYTPAASPSA